MIFHVSNKPKHSQLARPTIGQYHRNEWAIMGDHCDAIHAFAENIAQILSPLKVFYLDADHHPKEASSPLFYLQDQQSQWSKTAEKTDLWDIRVALSDADLVLINGNHFSASRQLVLINPEKENSLKKRLTPESLVDAIFFQEKESTPKYISELFPSDKFNYILKKENKIRDFFLQKIKAPEIKVLIMVGGKSTRMGQDKSLIKYSGQSQDLAIAEMCQQLNLPFAFSCSSENVERYLELGFEAITDTFTHLGPKGGILSGFQKYPDYALLVVACDLPFITKDFFKELIANRKLEKAATSFLSPENNMPEPLAAIWEPRSYLKSLQFLALGNSCPRKVLMQSNIYAFYASNPQWLTNINTPDEAALARLKLG